ncbi:MAG: hypothetical protein MJA83_16745, partial [Gammaproteobacteria bacterium]|nr:hypothetical protein [Gammaproteobacteria bacterium]
DKNVEPSTYLKGLIKEFIENWTPMNYSDETIFSQDELEFEIQPKLLKEHLEKIVEVATVEAMIAVSEKENR